MHSSSSKHFSRTIIKVPQHKVEIIEILKNEDIDIETQEHNNLESSDLQLTQEESSDSNLKVPMSEMKVKTETIDEWEKNMEEPNIDDLVEENIKFDDVQSENDDNIAFDDEDADQNWEPYPEKSSKRFVMKSECKQYITSEHSEEDPISELEGNKTNTSKKNISKNRAKETISCSVNYEYQCSYCDKKFPVEVKKNKHEERWHLNSLHCCQLCSFKTTTSFLLCKHVYSAHGRLMLECPFCKVCFPSLEVLRSHTMRAHNTNAFMCDKCRKVYTLEAYVKSHQKHCQSKKKVILNCEDCGKVFATRFTLEAHLEHHMGIKYECEKCHEVFDWVRSLYRHKQLKHKGITYRCAKCRRDFADDRGLAKHLKLVHNAKGGMPAKYECTMCPNKYWQKITLARHIKNFHCSPGDSLITVTKKVYRYSKRNNQYKLFSCHFCGKDYERKIDIRDHLRSAHYGVKYSCDICLKTFTFNSSLKKHKRDHETVGASSGVHCRQKIKKKECQDTTCYKCSICLVTYTNANSFRKHTKDHMKSKYTFCCAQCNLVFVRPKHLKQHESSVHLPSIIHYTCHYCLKSFRYKNHLLYHVQGYHLLSVTIDNVKLVKLDNDSHS